MSVQAGQWPDQLFETIKRGGVRQVGYVPDAGHARLIDRCRADPDIHDVVLTTEEEGIALAAGAWLGGQRAALLMQSSGLGNCINMLSLARTCRFPLLMLITMRGEWEEFNPWQVPMGSIVDPVLKLCEAEVYRVREPEEVAGIGKFLKFFADNDFEWSRTGHLPAYKAVITSDAFKALPHRDTVAAVADLGKPLPSAVQRQFAIQDIIGEEMSAAISGQKEVDAALKDAESRVNELLENL